MKILCLDLGTTTGWAVGDLEKKKHIKSGSEDLSVSRFESHGFRYIKFSRFLDRIHEKYGFTRCCFEAIRFAQTTDAAHMYGGFVAVLQSWCINHEVEYNGIEPQIIKKHITGKGNASKEEVINSVKIKLKIFPQDDNEADAVSLCDFNINS